MRVGDHEEVKGKTSWQLYIMILAGRRYWDNVNQVAALAMRQAMLTVGS